MISVPADPGSNHRRLGYLLPDFINLSLPNAQTDAPVWTRSNGKQQMAITAGTGIGPSGTECFIPYGKMARAALMFLCTDAVITGHKVIPVSDTYRGFLHQLGLAWNKRNCTAAIRQMQAVAASTITLTDSTEHEDGTVERNSERFTISFRDHMVFKSRRSQKLSDADPSHIELSSDFMRALTERGRVPIRADAWSYLLAHSKSAMALDLYVWLSYRLHNVKKPAYISWEQLYQQFGAAAELKLFKFRFRQALQVARVVYPEANVSEFGEGPRGGSQGIVLKLSKNALDSAWSHATSDPSQARVNR